MKISHFGKLQTCSLQLYWKWTSLEVFFKDFAYFKEDLFKGTLLTYWFRAQHACLDCCLDWFDILHNLVNLTCLNDIFRRWFSIKATCNRLLSKLSFVFSKNKWFFIIINTLTGFLSKPLELYCIQFKYSPNSLRDPSSHKKVALPFF